MGMAIPTTKIMNLRIIDSHIHVQFPEFDVDRKEVIQRAHEAGVGMINVGTDEETSRKAVELAREYEYGVWATVGIHPHETTQLIPRQAENLKTLEELAKDEKVVGIGECGLDYFRLEEEETKKQQEKLFVAQLELAKKVKKPIIIHCRPTTQKSVDAFEDILNILHTHKELLQKTPGICHFFTGTEDIAKKFLDRNFSFTFGGLITYNREFDGVLKYIPADHLLVETDAPFVSPKSHRGSRNEPSYIIETAEFLADFKKVPVSTFLENTKKVFGI